MASNERTPIGGRFVMVNNSSITLFHVIEVKGEPVPKAEGGYCGPEDFLKYGLEEYKKEFGAVQVLGNKALISSLTRKEAQE